MKKTPIALSFCFIAIASLALASDTEKRSQLEQQIAQLNDEIRLLDIKLEKYVTEKPERCREGRNLLGDRAIRYNILESKQQELKQVEEDQQKSTIMLALKNDIDGIRTELTEIQHYLSTHYHYENWDGSNSIHDIHIDQNALKKLNDLYEKDTQLKLKEKALHELIDNL